MVNLLKINPTPIPITLKNTIEWFKENWDEQISKRILFGKRL
jgi:hypothetical protein